MKNFKHLHDIAEFVMGGDPSFFGASREQSVLLSSGARVKLEQNVLLEARLNTI
jgi:hypothetical protein